MDAVLNLDSAPFAAAKPMDEVDFRIPSFAFYRALATWYRGYQKSDKSLKNNGIKGLRQAISNMESDVGEDSMEGLLAIGLARGILARTLLEGEDYFSGYRNGMEAREDLLAWLDRAPASAPGHADAGLLAGLYEVYTHDLQSRFHWLIGTIDYRGDRERGIRLLEAAVTSRGAWSSEALRALLGEVSWRLPDFCRYREIAESEARRLPRNRDLAVLSVGLLMRCGYPLRAGALVNWYVDNDASPEIRAPLMRAELRIRANTGDVAWLEQNAPTEANPHHLLALANALDVAGRREEALATYARLLDLQGAEPVFATVSRVRLDYPYAPPAQVTAEQFSPPSCDG